MKWGISQSRECELTVGNLITKLLSEHSRNPQRVSEAVHESSARINVIVPGHPDSLPGGGRITPIIYVGGGQAELKQWCGEPKGRKSMRRSSSINDHAGDRWHPAHTTLFPLREIARFVQGIVLFKERGSPNENSNASK